jgi:beta-glucanase (GH16 family)
MNFNPPQDERSVGGCITAKKSFMLMKENPKGLLLFFFVSISLISNAQTYRLVWSDEFNGKGLPDSAKWGYELGYVRNDELQYYTKSSRNVCRKKGNLEITVRREAVPIQGNKYGVPATFDYTSASIVTMGKNDWLYGKIEGRFKMPVGKSLWSCFWTLGSDIKEVGWPKCGEIDIFEHINNENIIYGTAHWADSLDAHTGKGTSSPELDVAEWHIYSVEWTPQSIKWLVDGKQYHELNILDGLNSTQEFHTPHYILVNLPIGGNWPGSPDATTILPATMYCDYIRVYQLSSAGK